MRAQTAFLEARLDAISAVLAQWRSQRPDLGVLVLLPEAEKGRVPDIQRAFREQGVPLVGAIFPALVTNQGFATDGVWLIGLDPMPPWFLLDNLNAGSRTAHSRIATAVRDALAPMAATLPPTVFFIFDAMVPNIGSIINGVYRDLHHLVRYAGINAGSETFQALPCLFDRDSLVGNGVIGFLLPDTQVIVKHGYPVAKTPMQAISTTGNRINIINQRPAFDVYQEVIHADFGVTLTPENFYDYAVHFPFGLIMATEVVVRIPVAFGDDGSIQCIGEVPPNAVLRLIKAPSLAQSQCVAAIAAGLRSHPSAVGDPLLTFYCAGRRLHLGAEAAEELTALQHETGACQVAGALSLGEIDTLPDFGTPVFHNAALVCL